MQTRPLPDFEAESPHKNELCVSCWNTRTFTHWDEQGEFIAQCPACVPPFNTPAYTAQQAADLAERCIANAFATKESA